MATTHRSRERGFAPDLEFRVVLDVLEAYDTLSAGRRSITPETIARRLSDRPLHARPTVPHIQAALVHIQRWRDQILTSDLLNHRRHLIALGAQLQTQRRQLDEVQFYLDTMLRATDTLLHNSLTPSSGAKPPAAGGPRPTTGGRHPNTSPPPRPRENPMNHLCPLPGRPTPGVEGIAGLPLPITIK